MSYAYKATDMSDGHDYTVGGFSTAKEVHQYLTMSFMVWVNIMRAKNWDEYLAEAQLAVACLRTAHTARFNGWEFIVFKENQ